MQKKYQGIVKKAESVDKGVNTSINHYNKLCGINLNICNKIALLNKETNTPHTANYIRISLYDLEQEKVRRISQLIKASETEHKENIKKKYLRGVWS